MTFWKRFRICGATAASAVLDGDRPNDDDASFSPVAGAANDGTLGSNAEDDDNDNDAAANAGAKDSEELSMLRQQVADLMEVARRNEKQLQHKDMLLWAKDEQLEAIRVEIQAWLIMMHQYDQQVAVIPDLKRQLAAAAESERDSVRRDAELGEVQQVLARFRADSDARQREMESRQREREALRHELERVRLPVGDRVQQQQERALLGATYDELFGCQIRSIVVDAVDLQARVDQHFHLIGATVRALRASVVELGTEVNGRAADAAAM